MAGRRGLANVDFLLDGATEVGVDAEPLGDCTVDCASDTPTEDGGTVDDDDDGIVDVDDHDDVGNEAARSASSFTPTTIRAVPALLPTPPSLSLPVPLVLVTLLLPVLLRLPAWYRSPGDEPTAGDSRGASGPFDGVVEPTRRVCAAASSVSRNRIWFRRDCTSKLCSQDITTSHSHVNNPDTRQFRFISAKALQSTNTHTHALTR